MTKNDKKLLNAREGQSIVEYIVLVAVVVVALLIFLGRGGPLEQAVDSSISSRGAEISNMATKIFF